MPLVGRDMIVRMHVLSGVRFQPRKTVVDGGTKETAKKLSLGMCYMWKTLVGLAVLLGSCFRDCAKNPTFVILNPPSPPYQGGIEWKVPLIRGI